MSSRTGRDLMAFNPIHPGGRPARILFYSPDSFGIGHLRRTLTLAAEFCRRSPDSSALVVSGSACATHFEVHDRVGIVKLPSVTKDQAGGYVSRSLPLEIEELTRLRSDLLLQAFRSYRPDILIVDHHPLGLRGEVAEVLDEAESAGVHRILGLRDVVDSPAAVAREWSGPKIRNALANQYERVCVYGSSELFDTRREYPIPPELRARVEFVGYVVREQEAQPVRPLPANRNRVLVTTGGGQDGVERVDRYLDAVLSERTPWDSTIVLGPLMDSKDALRLRRRARGSAAITVHDFHTDIPGLLSEADAVVSMAGYNTCSEILQHRVPAVLLPRVFPREEQKIRAERLAERGLVQTLIDDDPRLLHEAVAQALTSKPNWDGLPPLDGTVRTCEVIEQELVARSRAMKPAQRTRA